MLLRMNAICLNLYNFFLMLKVFMKRIKIHKLIFFNRMTKKVLHSLKFLFENFEYFNFKIMNKRINQTS